MSDRILVTGGAGFVGSHLCGVLRERGLSPVALDDLSNGIRDSVPTGVPLVVGDLAEPATYEILGREPFKAVFHLAAQSSNALSFRDPVRDLRANQLATLNLLSFCRDAGIRRVLFTSSMSAYGQPGMLPTPESEPRRPGTFYGLHKHASEEYLRIWGETYGLDWTVFRLYTTYGVGQNMANREQGLIKIYLGFVLRNEPLHVRGSGDRLRDCVHVTDVVDALLRAMDEPRSFGKVYNVGSGQPLRVSEILDLILREAGKDPASYPVTFTPGDPGDPHSTHADVSALARDFAWRPAVAPADGIRATVRAYMGAGARS